MRRTQGGITKTGNAHLRRVLVESAWHYRHHPFVSAAVRVRQRGAPRDGDRAGVVRPTAVTSALRQIRRPGKRKQHIVTAIARELTGFVWAALTR